MSADQTSSTSDLRSAAQDYKRDAARKHKWSMGAMETRGRGVGNPRPLRPSDTHKPAPRIEWTHPNKQISAARLARKQDMLEGTTSDEASSPNTSAASDYSDDTNPSPSSADADIAYSFDAARGPTQGSQIFNVALARAVEKFEERETVKLVRAEYDVLDGEGESLATASPAGKAKAKARGMGATRVPDADEDYEFV